jgi:hypothetical protein
MDIPYGKKIKSSRNEVLFIGFPGSDEVQTLPAGRPSLPVDSFIQGEFYSFVDAENNRNLYLRKNEDFQEIVEPGAEDESGVFSAFLPVADYFRNTGNSIQKNAGFISDGFQKSVSDLGMNLTLFGGRISWAVVAGVFGGILLWVYLQSKNK